VLPAPPASAETPQVSSFDTPTITTVRRRIVKVQVPAGYDRVTLERRAVVRTRPWVALSTQASDGAAGELVFRLRAPYPKRLLRVVGHKKEEVPAQLTGGLSDFFADETGSGTELTVPYSGGLTLHGQSLGASNFALALDSGFAGNAAVAAPRDVVESDIWKLKGDRLYVFNIYRGLQVIDVADPAEPGLLGTVYLPGAGENLYLLGDTHAVLLTRTASNFTWNHSPLPQASGAVIVCDVRNGAPKRVATLPAEGSYIESRLVGTALYIASEIYPADQPYGRPDVRVTGYDLSDPANPVLRNSVTLPAPAENSYSYMKAVQASDHFFLVAQKIYGVDAANPNEYGTRVCLVDISSPDGTVKLRGKVTTGGVVADKFKMQEHHGVLTLISNFSAWRSNVWTRYTQLENFSLADPDQPKKLGALELGRNETLFGTRFDGDRVYVVTFFQIDPLWIVDNSDPTKPAITGHLEVPGFSTYLQPLGDRLVTIGLLNGRPTVSLFDVADPANPRTLSQLPVTEQWATSEAVWNEKAFTVLPEEGLILLPLDRNWYLWGRPNAPSTGGVQLVDLERDSLKIRGRISHGFQPRRATVHRDMVLALGTASLLTADITNRDEPKVVSDLDLAWRADFVWHVGKHLVQIGGAVEGGDKVLTVSPEDRSDETLSSRPLPNEPVLAADYRDGYLYVLQQAPIQWGAALDDKGEPVKPPLKLSIYNLASLPLVVKVSETDLTGVPTLNRSGKILWPVPGTLVFAPQQNSYASSYGRWPITVTLEGFIPTPTPMITVIGEPGTGLSLAMTDSAVENFFRGSFSVDMERLVAIDVTEPVTPKLLAVTDLTPKFSASFSDAFAADGKVFVSHQHGWGNYYRTVLLDGAVLKADGQPGAENEEVEWQKVKGRYFLNVVDYSNPGAPIARHPVSAPGSLRGVTEDGKVVYTAGPDYRDDGWPKYDTHKLHASAYVGTKLHLAATYPLSGYGAEVLPMNDRLFVFATKPSPEHDNKLASYAQLIQFSSDTGFSLIDETIFGGWSFRVFDGVLVSKNHTGHGQAIHALDFTVPNDLRPLGFFDIGWHIYPDFSRAVGNRAEGLWIPVGAYGILRLEFPE
jgi:hypothetical protein